MTRTTTSPPRDAARLRVPLQWLLPGLTTAIVVGVFATGLFLASRMLKDAALDTARDRLRRSGHQLAVVSATAVQQGKTRYAAVAHDSVLHRTIAAPATPASARTVHTLLEKLSTPNDSGMPIELWNVQGRRLAYVGGDIRSDLGLHVRSELAVHVPIPRDGLDSIKATDSLQLGELYESGGRVYFWMVYPVIEHDTAVGYIAQQRRIAANPQTEQTLRELSGTSVTGYYRNVDGKFWATVGGRPTQPPQLSNERLLIVDERIAGTPLDLVLELPRDAVLAAPATLLRRLALFAAGLTLVAAVLAWLIGRRIAQPLGMLTHAAERVARGDYTARVPHGGPDEIERLSASFNDMAAKIGDAAAELEQREAEFRALANAIPQLAWMADPDGSIFWYNQRWFDYTGTVLEQMKGWGWQAVHDPARLPEILSGWRAAIDRGQRFEMEFPLRGADGTLRWFLTRVEPVQDRDGAIVRWFGTNTDVQDLREAREDARAASRAKSDFLATMSHELRTPLNAIGGYTELLEMELRGPISDAQRRDLARIRTSQQHLLGLISSVLDLSRIESGTVAYDLTDVNVDPMLRGLDALVAPQAGAKHLLLEYTGAPEELAVVADREKLRQILLNLLSNAIRYTPAGGRIVMCAEARGDASVAILVRDNGPGIPHDRRAAIFEPFVQLDRSLTQTREGVGLGLAISRDLAHGMKGELDVESGGADGEGARQGACFILTLPRGVAQPGALQPYTGEMPAARVL